MNKINSLASTIATAQTGLKTNAAAPVPAAPVPAAPAPAGVIEISSQARQAAPLGQTSFLGLHSPLHNIIWGS